MLTLQVVMKSVFVQDGFWLGRHLDFHIMAQGIVYLSIMWHVSEFVPGITLDD